MEGCGCVFFQATFTTFTANNCGKPIQLSGQTVAGTENEPKTSRILAKNDVRSSVSVLGLSVFVVKEYGNS